MAATVRGTFTLVDRASTTLKRIEKNAIQADLAVKKLGASLDSVGSSESMRKLDTASRKMKDIGASSKAMSVETERSTKATARHFEGMAVKATGAIEAIRTRLNALGRQKARPEIEMGGFAAFMVESEILIRQMRRLDRAAIFSSLKASIGELMGAIGGGSKGLLQALGGGGKSLMNVMAAVGQGAMGLLGNVNLLVAGLVVAAAAIVPLAGALGALASSFGVAAAGLGAFLTGGVGVGVVGLAGIAAVALPAIKRLTELKQAQDEYNKAVKESGRGSRQAVEAQKALQKAQQGTGGFNLSDVTKLGSRFSKATRPGQSAFFGALNDTLDFAKQNVKEFGDIANGVAKSTRKAWSDFLMLFQASINRGVLSTLGKAFSDSIGPLSRALGYVAAALGDIAVAASPYVLSFFQQLESWARSWSDVWSRPDEANKRMSKMMGHLGSWLNLLGAIWKLIKAVFAPAAGPGKSAVERMTKSISDLADRINKDPDSVSKWFNKAVDDAAELYKALEDIVSVAAELADALRPLVRVLSDLVQKLDEAGALAPVMAGGLGYLLLGGGRRRRGPGGKTPPQTPGGGGGGTTVIPYGPGSDGARPKGDTAPKGKGGRVVGGAKSLLKGGGLLALLLGGLEGVSSGNANKGLNAAWDAMPTTFIAGLLGLDISSRALGMAGSGNQRNSGLSRYSGSKGWGNAWRDITGQKEKVTKVDPKVMGSAKGGVAAGVAKAVAAAKRADKDADKMVSATKRVDKAQDKLGERAGKTKTKVESAWKGMNSTVGSVSRSVLQQTNALLRAFGAGSVSAPSAEAPKTAGGGGKTPAGAQQGNATGGRLYQYASGGRIPGTPKGDHIPLYGKGGLLGIADGGELVVNRHTESRVNNMLAAHGTSLGREVSGERTPHNRTLPVGRRNGGYFGGFATGGRAGVYTASVYSDPQGYKGDMLAQQPNNWAELGVGGGVGNAFGGLPYKTPIRISYKGKSIRLTKLDIGSGGPGLGGAIRAVDVYQPAAQRIGLPGLANVSVSFDGSMPGGDERVVAPRVRGKGAQARIAQGASTKLTSAANKLVDRNRPKDVGQAAAAGGGGNVNGLQPIVLRAIAWARKHGWTGSISSGFRTRAEQAALYASKGPGMAAAPGTSNHEKGLAIDITDPAGFARAMQSAPANARLYSRIGHEPWHWSTTGYSKGGRVPRWGGWHARGGDLRVNQPTLLGVGERGAETVSIRPAGKGGAGGGMQVKVDIGSINYSGKGEIKDAIKREVSQAFSELSSELDYGNSGVTS